MPSLTVRPFSASDRPALSRRAIALLLAIAIHGLLILMLLTLGPALLPRKQDRSLPVSFSLAPAPDRVAAMEKKVSRKPENKVAPMPKAATSPPVKENPPTSELPFIIMNRQNFASTDIGKMPSREKGGAQAGDSKSIYGPGQGPGGERLYNVEWLREPTDAEMAPYIPANLPPDSWAAVACRTIENNQVENCQSVGESPPGSGIARGMRLAAWQYRIIPPRIGGRPLIGVLIYITYRNDRRFEK